MPNSNNMMDAGDKVRRGEELDLALLNPWLIDQLPGISGTPEVTQFSGGASNWTYCLSYPEKALVLRRAPDGTKAQGAHDMGREYRLQAALKPVYPYVPEVLLHSDDESIVGAQFYVMEKLNGLIPRTNMPRGLDLSEQQCRELCFNALDSMIELHQVDYKAAGLDQIGKGEGYIERQIRGWTHRYNKAKTWNVPSGKGVIQWLADNMPETETICLTHNDFRLDNLVLDAAQPTKIIGVLDWELATLGDPLMDLGNTLAYWVEAGDDFFAQKTRRQPTHLEGMLSRQEVIDYYLQKTDSEVKDFTFYEVYGLFRLAGIVQQIYYRYHHKQTRNPAFKILWVFVHYLMHRCRKAINKAD
ncbi:MAG: aminoglycoside phosphotransferase (APT) family kinase protein [Arenicella sp.]|jgi:aminoglycoside phosphotransferase (APT) family kinase protein